MENLRNALNNDYYRKTVCKYYGIYKIFGDTDNTKKILTILAESQGSTFEELEEYLESVNK